MTSRPANSERYLVCLWKRLGTEPAEEYLASVNRMLWKGAERGGDVLQLVPLDVIEEDKNFYEYIYKSNCVYVVCYIIMFLYILIEQLSENKLTRTHFCYNLFLL